MHCKLLIMSKRGQFSTKSWGSYDKAPPRGSDRNLPSNYEKLVSSTVAEILTPDLLDEFLTSFPDADNAKRDARKFACRIIDVNDDLLRRRGGAASDVGFTPFLKSSSQDVVSKWIDDEGRRSRLTTHSDLRELWCLIGRWQCPDVRGYRGDHGWFSHGARLLARASWWRLNDSSKDCNNWSATSTSNTEDPSNDLVEAQESFKTTDDVVSECGDRTRDQLYLVSNDSTAKESTQSPVSTKGSPPNVACSLDEVASNIEQHCDAVDSISFDVQDRMTTQARRVRKKMHDQGNRLANAELVALRDVPQIVNPKEHDRDMSTEEVWRFVDSFFASMTPAEYRQGRWRGLETYYEPHPSGKGYRAIGKEFGQRAAQMDHAFAQFCCPFNHPRFYIVMPAPINNYLRTKEPEHRIGFGLRQSTLRQMSCDIQHMTTTIRRKRMFDDLYAALPRVQDVHSM